MVHLTWHETNSFNQTIKQHEHYVNVATIERVDQLYSSNTVYIYWNQHGLEVPSYAHGFDELQKELEKLALSK